MIRLAISLAALMATSTALAETPVERGSYLVNTIMTCGNCHSPQGLPEVVAGKDFSGGRRSNTPLWDVTAGNITPDSVTGIGRWTGLDIKNLILKGVRPNGVPIAPVMPIAFYGILLPSDLDAIVVYLQSLKPVSNKVPDPIYKRPFEREIFPDADKPIDPALLSDKVQQGRYLATVGHCMECHTPLVDGEPDFTNSLGKGGRKFGPFVASNITSSKMSGLGSWTDAAIRRAITQGIDKDGNKLKGPMGFVYYSHMTDSDLNAVVAWLRTVPPKD